MSYVVNYTTPRGESGRWIMKYLGAEIYRPVCYRFRHDGWREMLASYGHGIFTEVYVPRRITPSGEIVAEFVRLERLGSFKRYDQARLPE